MLPFSRVPTSQLGLLRGSLASRYSCRATPHVLRRPWPTTSVYKAFGVVRLSSTTSTGIEPVKKTWIDSLPPKVRPYLYLTRIDKPIGTLLLFWPCTWSIAMASYALHLPPSVPLTYISLCGIGALVMRGAGCTINDMWDKNLDKSVARTKERPLARGDLTRKDAFIFLGGQLGLGLAVLLQFNWYSILLGASSLSLVTIYPFMKRVTHWPQAVLGLAFNWGALLGWSAVAGTVDWAVCLPLYAGGVCWTLVYDSIYAHQDKLDDVHAGIKSTALLFADKTRSILTGLSLSSMSLVSYAGYLNHQTEPFYAGVALGLAQLGRILYRTDFEDRKSCWEGFASSGWVGFWIWAGAMADYGLSLVALG
ncbi:para-hydroxybenzoate-polyprenyltransferase [Coprinopsis cinerea okayama7|uniref:4-hydroxybenzoate polyprenyltransferase, mitochondrial n=1 Tax=Coprinopsis cinerea (strain Okayama-7 / 130 / ATCC MYA-4618 / FGSC 9003) TaxID=240176 RepID=D6RMJ5_COPC7|nr:para-hydroxybenzoate-polyprenyltransferase [Coprinopsis cinerea okayama7\|eukprot:XP_002911228.1 para-hydroxybenzoate-polyprenyltransferase [Coprinopsis cinerea okayama7\